MKIVHIITSLGIGGAEKLLVNVANNQSRSNRVVVIYFKDSTLVNDFSTNVSVIHIPLNKEITRNIKNILLDIKPNILHTHLTHADLFGLVAARKCKNIKTFTTIHNTKYRHNIIDYLYYSLYIILFNIISPKTKLIAISKSLEKQIHTILKIPKKRIVLLYNTISEAKENKANVLLKDTLCSKEKFKILFIGRLSKQKAVHILIEAISLLEDRIKKKLAVFIVGKGDLEDSLKLQVEQLGLNDIIFFEGMSDRVQDYFQNSNIFVLPSIFEGLPLVLLEAFRYGIPTIASDIDGPAELIVNGENGFLCKKNDVRDFADKITILYDNKDLCKKFVENSNSFFYKNFCTEVYLTKLYAIYNQ